MRKLAVLVLTGLTGLASACAPKPAPVVVATAPRYPEFVRPPVPQDLAGTSAAKSLESGWGFLQSGDFKSAERDLAAALRASASFYPAEAGTGYLELARKNPAAALGRFDRALEERPDYASALVGRGEALTALNRDTEAADAFERAVAADPSLSDLAPKAAVLRFRGVERDVAAAREAARGNDADKAIQLYNAAIASSPESAFLYRELAAVERRRGNSEAALAHLRKASALEPTDVTALTQTAEILEAGGDIDGAIAAYGSVLEVEPNETIAARRDALRARTALAKLPEQYRAIEAAPSITRADLAALIALRLAPLVHAGASSSTVVITDVRGNWAEPWIMDVARAGVLQPYDNHTFQPRGTIRRVDLAEAVSRLLLRVATLTPGQSHPWQNSRGRFPDVSTTHLSYPAVSVAVASGVMPTAGDNAFEPSRPVTGAEASDAIGRLEAMTRPTGSQPARR